MRHNQNNGRRFRGHNNGGGQQSRHHHNGGGNNGQRRSVNPRVQTFDSNGPEVRIRGNATQINEKYLTLARDAMSAGDRVLAESYFQHAEHYQRMLNEANEEFARNNPQAYQQQQQQLQQQKEAAENGEQPAAQVTADSASGEQPVVAMDDLDQGFLVGNRQQASAAPQPGAEGGEGAQPQQGRHQRRNHMPPKEAETA